MIHHIINYKNTQSFNIELQSYSWSDDNMQSPQKNKMIKKTSYTVLTCWSATANESEVKKHYTQKKSYINTYRKN